MRIRFNGGLWDGVECDVPICPDAIAFRHLLIQMEPVEGEPLIENLWTDKREHHQYVLDQPKIVKGVELKVGDNLEREPAEGEPIEHLVNESVLVMHYRYAPEEKLWWED